MEICGFISSSEIIIVLFLALIVLGLPIIALVDILKSEFEGNNKLIWVIVILLSWLLGAIIYFFIGRQQKIQR